MQLTILSTVAEKKSFRAAANELGVSPSAISQAVTNMETLLNIKLLSRSTRSVSLTQAGHRFLARINPALTSIRDAFEETASEQSSPVGTLIITAPRTACELLLMPILSAFSAKYPAITIDLRAEDQHIDIVAAGYDAGLRLGENLEQDMIAIPIGQTQRMQVIGAPSYFQHYGKPKSLEDLKNHVCINRRFANGKIYKWEFEEKGHAISIAVNGPITVNDTQFAIYLAREGIGLAYVMEKLVSDDLATGQLETCLEEFSLPFPGFYLYHSSRRQMRPVLRVFIDFLRQAHT